MLILKLLIIIIIPVRTVQLCLISENNDQECQTEVECPSPATSPQLLLRGDQSGCLCRASACFGPECKIFPNDVQIAPNSQLSVIRTSIQSIKNGDIPSNLQHLKTLELKSNFNLTRIYPGAFSSLTNLQNLTISYCANLNYLENGTFSGLHNLKEVSLVKNGFSSISRISSALDGTWLPQLIKLDLSENNFSEIKRSHFEAMQNSNVEELNLILCRIESVEAKSFTLLKKLRVLRLGENGFDSQTITELVRETVKLVHLRSLNLCSIGLRKTPPRQLLEVIANSNITTLILARNQFEIIGPNTFPAMPNLEVLDLRHDLTLTISNMAFVGMPKLQKLLLGGNILSSIPDGVLLEQLTYLDLKLNSGRSRSGGYFTVYGRKFTHMKSLKVLDLSFNRIHAIYNESFTGLSNLDELGLKNATIYFIAPRSFVHLKNLRCLNLENNVLRNNGLSEGVFDGLHNLKVLLLGGCGLRAINATENPFRDLQGLVRLGLEGNNLLTLANIRFPSNLRSLDVSNNLLQPWPVRIFSENKKVVVFKGGYNKLAFLSKSMIEDFENLTKLDLVGNPFSCECSYKWRNSKVLGLISNQSFFCAFPDVTTNLTVQNFFTNSVNCPSDYYYNLKIISTLVFLLISILVISSTIYYYRWYLRYWLFLTRLYLSRKGRIKNTRNKNLLAFNNYVYDAFVSYSNEDRNFVIRLVGMLEKYPPFLKLCVYERDFEVGAIISENVLESVAKSRKTLLIISDSYAKSQWCRWESQIAEHHRLFFNNEHGEYVDDSLILIKLGPVNQAHLTPTLKFLLKTRIYLQWDSDSKKQQHFWEKLRSTLAPPVEIIENTHL